MWKAIMNWPYKRICSLIFKVFFPAALIVICLNYMYMILPRVENQYAGESFTEF